MSGQLFIVATPIGNLEDITQHALRVLREVDLIACEDTRHTQKLLNHFGLNTRTISYHEHNERERADELCGLIEQGKSIALVSDAGTPLINDPGFRIVRAAIDRAIHVVPVPGATAFVAALSASGMPTNQFFFAGFLPARANSRRAKLEELRQLRATLIFYEAPHRIGVTLKDASDILGSRQGVVARELTKLHEEIARGTLNELATRFERQKPKGEIVIIIEGAKETALRSPELTASNSLVSRVQQLEQEGVDAKGALKIASRELGIKRAEAYRMMMAQKNRRSR